MSPADYVLANRRLCILKILSDDGGHSNESVIETALLSLGHHSGTDRDSVRGWLRELEASGAITLEYYRDRVMVAHLTSRGLAAAQGRIQIDGVAKPAIGE